MNVIPGDDILQARGHGGTDGEDKALFKGLAQQAQHAVPLGAVREVGHAVRSRIANARIGVFGLWTSKGGENKSIEYLETTKHQSVVVNNVSKDVNVRQHQGISGTANGSAILAQAERRFPPASHLFLVQGATSVSGL